MSDPFKCLAGLLGATAMRMSGVMSGVGGTADLARKTRQFAFEGWHRASESPLGVIRYLGIGPQRRPMSATSITTKFCEAAK